MSDGDVLEYIRNTSKAAECNTTRNYDLEAKTYNLSNTSMTVLVKKISID